MVPRKGHGAGTVRIHSIGSGDIQIPIIADNVAKTEVKDQSCRDAGDSPCASNTTLQCVVVKAAGP